MTDRYTIAELVLAKGTSRPVAEALLAMERKIVAQAREIARLRDVLGLTDAEIARLKDLVRDFADVVCIWSKRPIAPTRTRDHLSQAAWEQLAEIAKDFAKVALEAKP